MSLLNFWFTDNYFSTSLILNHWTQLLCIISLFILFFCFPFCISNSMASLLIQTTLFSLLFFSSNSTLLIYVLLEISSLPIVYLILLFGSQAEILQAALFLGLYSLSSRLPFVLIIISTTTINSTWLELPLRNIPLLFLQLPFIVKLPCYLLHLWLPKAHVEAPTTGRVLLAAIILKLGSYGLIRFGLFYNKLLLFLTVLRILLCPLLSCLQRDSKALVAFRSIGHIGLIRISLWVIRSNSLFRRWLSQIAHGYASGLLFFFVGSARHTLNTRIIYYSQVEQSFSFFLALIFNAGAPLSLPFIREIFLFSSTLHLNNLIIPFFLLIALFTNYFNLYLFLTSSSNNRTSSSLLELLPLILLVNLMILYLLNLQVLNLMYYLY